MHTCDLTVMTDGRPDAALMVVAQSPGSEEIAYHTPLIGLSGKILWANGSELGLFRESVFILNSCCQVPTGGTSKAQPTAKQLAECRPTFERLLASASPRVILTLGGPALRAITGLDLPVNDTRGYLLRPSDVGMVKAPVKVSLGYYKTSKKGKYAAGDERFKTVLRSVPRSLPMSVEWVIATLHPAAVHYEKYNTLPAFRTDLMRAVRATEQRIAPISGFTYSTTPRALSGEIVAFDTETTMDHRSLLTMGMADGKDCWTSPWNTDCAALTRHQLSDESTTKVAHNISFDLTILARYNVPVRGPLFCTMLGFQLVQPDLFKGLGRIAPIYFDLERWKHLSDVEPEKYNAFDAWITRKLYPEIRTDLIATGQLGLFENTIMKTVPTLVEMKRRGLRVSEERLVKWQAYLGKRERRLLRLWTAGTGGVSPTSNPDVARLLYDKLGLPAQRNWKTKQLSVDEYALGKLRGRGHDSLIRLLLALRKTSKLRGTYAKSNLDWDMRIHPNYLPAQKEDDDARKGSAGSGRLAASEPNIQNQPMVARRIYVPSEGMVLLAADWSQAEPRSTAFVSGDPKLLAALEGDLYARLAYELGVPRQMAKVGVLATIYACGPKQLEATFRENGLSVPMAEVKAFQRRIATEFPIAWSWREQVMADGRANGYVVNPFTRRRPFNWPSEQGPAMIDFIPQSIVGDALWEILAPLNEAMQSLGGGLVTTVHDEVVAEVPRRELYSASRAFVEIMGREFPQVAPGFRLPVELKWSASSWGEMEKLPFDQRVLEAIAPAHLATA